MKKYGDLNELKDHIKSLTGCYWDEDFWLEYRAVERAIDAAPEEDLVPRAVIEEIFDAFEKIMQDNLHHLVCIGNDVQDYYDVDLYDAFWELRKKYVKTKNLYPNQDWECPKCGAVMSPTTSCCVNCRGNNSFQSSLSSQSRYDDDYDYEVPTAQQILNKTIEYELRKMGDNISPLGGDR